MIKLPGTYAGMNFIPTQSETMTAILFDCGFCLLCGNKDQITAPLAKLAKCDSCGKKALYGAEQLLIMELFIRDRVYTET